MPAWLPASAFIVSSILALEMTTAATATQPSDPPDLFSRVSTTTTAESGDEYPARRTRFVSLNETVLSAWLQEDIADVSIELFDGLRVTAHATDWSRPGVYAGHPSSIALAATVPGFDMGRIDLVRHRKCVLAMINLPGAGLFQVRSIGNGEHVLHELDPSKFHPCDAIAAPALPPPAEGTDGPVTTDGIVDIMVLYTPNSRDQAGGEAEVETHALLGIQLANAAFENSAINTRLRLVHLALIQYTESGDSVTDLVRLRLPSDGFIDQAHTLRNLHGADVVTMLFANSFSCGTAFVMQAATPAFEAIAFNVVNWVCSASNLSLAHEVGHNMGCAHDRNNAQVDGVFDDFSFGYQHSGHRFRTLMSLNCGDPFCPRIVHFSNPDIEVGGFHTGVPIHRPDASNNALSINSVVSVVAAYRTRICNPPVPGLNDCNQNCVDDEWDVATGLSADANVNGVPDECECVGDLDQDGEVGVNDLLHMLGDWGACSPPCAADIDQDEVVAVSDLLALLSNWGPC